MPTLNVKYYITDEEVVKLCSNIYTRSGDSLKNNLNGSKIFKHMKEIDWNIEKDKSLEQVQAPAKNFSWLLNFVKTRTGITIAVILSVITIGIFLIYLWHKKKKERETEVNEAYYKFNKTMLEYIGAITEGKVTQKIIKSVVDATNVLIDMKKSKKYKVSFDDEQIGTLLDICQKYANELAETKGVQLQAPKSKNNTDSKIVQVCWYMKQQTELLKNIA